MIDIVERLRGQVTGDHIRGCMGRQYSCNCGYDAETEKLLAEAAAEIERLRHESRMLALCEGDRKEMAAEIGRLREAVKVSANLMEEFAGWLDESGRFVEANIVRSHIIRS